MPRGLKNKQRKLLEDMGFNTAKLNRHIKWNNSKRRKKVKK